MPRQVAPSVDAATWTARIHDRRRMIAHESGTHQLPCRVPRPALDSPEYHRTHAYAYACARMRAHACPRLRTHQHGIIAAQLCRRYCERLGARRDQFTPKAITRDVGTPSSSGRKGPVLWQTMVSSGSPAHASTTLLDPDHASTFTLTTAGRRLPPAATPA